jgi:hypothetical protein
VVPWANIITGLVGVAGIGGTLWQGKRARQAASADLRISLSAAAVNLQTTISAENDRSRLVDKRGVYAGFMAAAENLMLLGGTLAELEQEESDKSSLKLAIDVAMRELYMKFMELWLVAPSDVWRPAMDLVAQLGSGRTRLTESLWMGEYSHLQGLCLDAMRADLGITDL